MTYELHAIYKTLKEAQMVAQDLGVSIRGSNIKIVLTTSGLMAQLWVLRETRLDVLNEILKRS